jgi:3-oxoacyl-[acyl-carrier protein] reductase
VDLGLKGKTALVTGSSKGIGRAIARELAFEGAQVVACARDKANLEELKRELDDLSQAHIFACDLADRLQREALVKDLGTRKLRVDILVHNVGGPKPTEVTQTSQEDWLQGFEQLFQSVVHLNEAFLPAMKEQGFGRILCVTSLSTIEPIGGLAISNAIRSGVTAMLKSLADEVAPYGITVNCLAPGAIATDRLQQLMASRIAKSGVSEEDYNREYLKAIPMKRLGLPEEFAAMAAFLASTRASYVTGSTICLDGGKRRSTV